jgi:resuscitation-promoting factor RpfB
MKAARTLLTAALSAALLLGLSARAQGEADSTLSVDEARRAVDVADATVHQLRTRLGLHRLDRAEYLQRLEQRSARRDQAARDLRQARTTAQDLAVAAYIGAGTNPAVDAFVAAGVEDPLDYTYHVTLVQDSTNARYRAAAYYRDLREQASDAVDATVARLDELEEAIATTETALAVAEDAQRTAAIALEDAQAAMEAAARLASVPDDATAAVPPGGWVPLGEWPGGPSYAQWSALRQCESGGNYHAVSPSGLYRGAYQFDVHTWRSVGGSGDPAMAPPEEQDHRAQVLWSLRGASPWPICGRYLT